VDFPATFDDTGVSFFDMKKLTRLAAQLQQPATSRPPGTELVGKSGF